MNFFRFTFKHLVNDQVHVRHRCRDSVEIILLEGDENTPHETRVPSDRTAQSRAEERKI
jgi:hypothetical protein